MAKSFLSGLLRFARNDGKRQSGNAVIFILIAVALFGALSYTFMRGSKSGQGNLTSNQARLAAQELMDFFIKVEKAVNRLRSRGCSENDISFSNPKDTGTFIASNHTTTAPGDFSCHVFKPEGGGLTVNMDWSRYQIPINQIAVASQPQHNNIYFRVNHISIVGVGTASNELMIGLNWGTPAVCDAYNKLASDGGNITYVPDAGTLWGDENTSFVGRTAFCKSADITQGGQIFYVWLVR